MNECSKRVLTPHDEGCEADERKSNLDGCRATKPHFSLNTCTKGIYGCNAGCA
jgi:hypothetical protein